MAAIPLSGCATNYYVLTNTYLDKTNYTTQMAKGSSFAVLTNQNAPNPIFDNEIRLKIEHLLSSNGYRVESGDKSDYFITFNYGISGRAKTEMWPNYVRGHDVVQRVYVSGSNTYYTVVSPGYEYVTYVPETYTVYTAKIFLKALEADNLRKNKKEKVVWVGDTMNESANPNLRESIDYLLVATFKYFGKDTGKNQEVVLSPNDKEVLELRNPVQPFPVSHNKTD